MFHLQKKYKIVTEHQALPGNPLNRKVPVVSRLNAQKRLDFLWFLTHKNIFNYVQYKKNKTFI